MKSLTLFLCCIASFAWAQQADVIDLKEHLIVMQFSDGDSLSQASVTGQVKNIRSAWPNAKVEVVCHGPGLDLLIANKSKMAKVVAEWSSQGVVFAACNNTMRKEKSKKRTYYPQGKWYPPP